MQLERPKTQASLALSGAASISSAGASSLDGSKLTVQLEPKRSAGFVAAASSRAEESLPGAMLPGRYAFWPKRLPSGASRQSRATKGSSGSLSARGVAATAAPAVPQPLLAPL